MNRAYSLCCPTLVLLLALVGCGGESPPGEDAGGARDGGAVDARLSCPSGTEDCEGACVDVSGSRAHCGACGTACAAGEACVDGDCSVLCPSGQVECDGACVDTDSDREHCGACGAACDAGELCEGGSCAVACPPSLSACSSGCVDTSRDFAHCGACDAACDPGQVCSAGVCTTECASGVTECSGSCIDLTLDPRHCGACDAACTAASGALGVCVGGSCRAICEPSMGDCNADLGSAGGDGCETPLATDPENCGACGLACSFADGVAGCSAGSCVIAMCDAGYDDCDGDLANGCEASLTDDLLNCGACGTVCGAEESCVDGACLVPLGDTCEHPIVLTTGINNISWTAFGNEYLTAIPSCGSSSSDGPDLVLSYTAGATRDERVSVEFSKPTSTRWSSVVSLSACGTLLPEETCMSEFSADTMSGSFTVPAGATAYIYIVDTTSGSNPLNNPLTVTVRATPVSMGSACTPGMDGVVGTTQARLSTGLSSFIEYFVAADDDPAGWVYFGGTGDLYRVPKAGGAVEDIEALASLTTAQMGYTMLVDGSHIYTVDSITSGLSGRVYLLSDDGGTTWDVRHYAFFPTSPSDDIRGITASGGRIYMVTEEDSTGVPTEIWSVEAGIAPPAIARLEASVTGEGDCNAIAVDLSYYYLACTDGSDRVVRVPRVGGPAEVVTTTIDLSATNNVLHGHDTDADGIFDALYVQTQYEEVYYICSPSSTTPIDGTLGNFGTGSGNYGLGFDAVGGVLWMIDDDTRELVSFR